MSNPFSNAHRAVETYSFNKTNSRVIDKMSDTAAANSALRNKQIEEQDALFESQVLQKERANYYNKLNTGVVNRYIKESQIPNTINKIANTAKDIILKDILFEVFYNSLVMDESFLVENCDCLKHLTDKYVDDNGGFEMLNKAIGKNGISSEILKRIKKTCECIALEVCERKIKDSKAASQIDLIDFDMTEDEKNKLDYAKTNNLNIDQISTLVKNKVLTVVKDEKERHDASSELIEKIEEDLKNDENVVDEDSLKEAMNHIIINKSVVEESTLFDALFRDSYREFIMENVAITSTDKHNNDEFKELSREYDTEMDLVDALSDEEPTEDMEVNMDLILTEAITKYTLMETLYTLGLEDYSHENMKKLTERILNPVAENTIVMESEEFTKTRAEFFKLFNKLKDDPSNETLREKMSSWLSSICENDDNKKHCTGFIKIANSQIDQIIEKNPKMKDKYTDLSEFMNGLV